MKLRKSEAYLYFGSLIISVVFVGLFFNFQFLKGFDLQLHDGYLTLFPWQVLVIISIIFPFLVFLIKGLKSGFKRREAVWVLVVHNTLIIGLVLIVFQLIYSFYAVEAFINFLKQENQDELLSKQLYFFYATFFVVVFLLGIAEFFLIRRIIQLKKVK